MSVILVCAFDNTVDDVMQWMTLQQTTGYFSTYSVRCNIALMLFTRFFITRCALPQWCQVYRPTSTSLCINFRCWFTFVNVVIAYDLIW